MASGAAAVVLHPHPGMGGDRNHPLVVAITDGLQGNGITAVRPDLTDPDVSVSSARLESVARELLAESGAEQLFLVGYSWGSAVTSLAAPECLAARVLVAPPVSMLELWERGRVPTLVLVPAHDQYGGPGAVKAVMREWPATTIEVVEGADHFLAGAMGRIADRAVTWLLSCR